jgi:eukaryotic-like serine/threonine-protein kinase
MPGDDLEGLLDRWEEARDRGEPISPEELCRDRPELLAELAGLIDELRAVDAFLDGPTDPGRTKMAVLHPAEDAPAEGPAPASRYRDERFLAEGGLGRVFVARDAELPREVALKRLNGRVAASREGRRRFVFEAEITASLEHPGIVPVYGLGVDRDGLPFYAMRLIRGETMGRAIERFHEADAFGRDPGERTLALQGLLRAFLATCQTIAYAHSRGVIHRDLKPSNVMLGPYGEAIVVDWGLAKPLGDFEEAGDAAGPMPRDKSDATAAGTVKGSPAYMSPEQAGGRVDQVGPASDVYSLGATLYTLLTGQRPVQGNSMLEVLEGVRRGNFPPPRRVKPEVPRALEAVCLKAMALEPGGRYAGASELASDVERWLSGEPVSAWREPWCDRLRRWGRRHRVVVASAAAALVAGAAILAATNGRLRLLAGRLDASNVALRGALDDAERNLYARDLDLADRSWWEGQAGPAATLLDECPPARRGWEWRYLARRNRPGLSSSHLVGLPKALGVDGRGRVVAVGAGGELSFESRGPDIDGPVRLAAVDPGRGRVAFVAEGRPGEVVVIDSVGRGTIARFAPEGGTVEGLTFRDDGLAVAMTVVNRRGPPADSKDKVSFLTEFEARIVVRELATGREEASAPFVASGWPGPPAVLAGGRCVCPVTFGGNAALFVARPGSPGVERAWSGEAAADGAGVVVSRDGFRLAVASEGHSVTVREIASGQLVATLRGHSGPIRALAFGPDGRRLASASDDLTVRIWDVDEARTLAVLRGQSGPASRLAFSADGSRLASASADEVVVWDPARTSEALVVRTPERPHLAGIEAGPGGLAAVVAAHRLSWRRVEDGKPAGTGEEVEDIDSLASSPRGSWTAAGLGDGSVVLFDREGRPARTLPGHARAVTGLAFAPDGSKLASASKDGDVRVREAGTGRELARFRIEGTTGDATALAFAPDGASLAVGDGAGGVVVVDSAAGRALLRFSGAGAPVRRLTFRADGALLAVVRSAGPAASASRGREGLAVYEAATARPLYEAGDHPSGVTDAAFSPDGTRLASGDRSGLVRVREAATGRTLLTLRGPSDPIARLAFTPDGSRLLAAGGRVDPLGLRVEEADELTIWDGRPPE